MARKEALASTVTQGRHGGFSRDRLLQIAHNGKWPLPFQDALILCIASAIPGDVELGSGISETVELDSKIRLRC